MNHNYPKMFPWRLQQGRKHENAGFYHIPRLSSVSNSYTIASSVRDFADIYAQTLRVAGPRG